MREYQTIHIVILYVVSLYVTISFHYTILLDVNDTLILFVGFGCLFCFGFFFLIKQVVVFFLAPVFFKNAFSGTIAVTCFIGCDNLSCFKRNIQLRFCF